MNLMFSWLSAILYNRFTRLRTTRAVKPRCVNTKPIPGIAFTTAGTRAKREASVP